MLVLLAWALLAEIMGTIAWFGSSSIFLPIAHEFLTYHNALILVAIYHIFGNISRFSLFWRSWDRKIFVLFGVPSIIATVIGAQLAWVINPNILKIFLGIVLIVFAWYSLMMPAIQIILSPWMGRLWWALSGFTAWLIGTGGVLRWAFMTLFGLTKESYIATIASVALLVDITRIPVYLSQWWMDPEHYIYIPVLFVIAFIWSWIGKQIVACIDTQLLRKIILIMIMVMSIWLIYQGWVNL